ncbi:MAG: mitochondrial fission ELM1 family protein [Thiogranum sp.]
MPVIIWRFVDGKAGHDAQSRGLVTALQERFAVTAFDIPVGKGSTGFWSWLTAAYPPGRGLPVPDLLLGAGHATHWHLLAARRRWGGRIVLLMKPTLPVSCFDLCLVPEHDGLPAAANVMITRGVLNDVRPDGGHDAGTGLILLGGPTRHYRWRDDDILAQLERLVGERPLRRWLLTTSPRTPASLLQRLGDRPEFEITPYVPGNSRLADSLAGAGEAWVTEDSVSMIYEALSAGVRVGLLKVQRNHANRVTAGVDALVQDGWVGAPGRLQLAAGPAQPLNEAQRCADWIEEHWLTNH